MAWRNNPDFNRVLDAIYASYMTRKNAIAGKPDREVRDPEIILGIAGNLDLLPDPSRTLRITGSKGKGTTARMIARLLQEETDDDVGLLVSPEETDHNDRIRVNGQAIGKAEFIDLFERLRPHLDAVEAALPSDKYLSPSGTFLLMALAHFKANNVSRIVLEGGRGARFDEVGQVPSDIGVLTSVLLEHPTYLGPDLAAIAADKLSIGEKSRRLICTPDVAAFNDRLNIVPSDRITVINPRPSQRGMPQWFETNRQLAISAVEAHLDRAPAPIPDLDGCSAAFGRFPFGDGAIYFDACVNAASLDGDYLEELLGRRGPAVILASLPDDKDIGPIRSILNRPGRHYREIALSGTRGYLNYRQTLSGRHCIADLHYEDSQGFADLAMKTMAVHSARTLYCVGTQTFIRLVKSISE